MGSNNNRRFLVKSQLLSNRCSKLVLILILPNLARSITTWSILLSTMRVKVQKNWSFCRRAVVVRVTMRLRGDFFRGNGCTHLPLKGLRDRALPWRCVCLTIEKKFAKLSQKSSWHLFRTVGNKFSLRLYIFMTYHKSNTMHGRVKKILGQLSRTRFLTGFKIRALFSDAA